MSHDDLRPSVHAYQHNGFTRFLVLFGYVFTYIAGILLADIIIALFNGGIQQAFSDGVASIAWVLGIFIVAPITATLYHKLLEKYRLTL